MKVLKDKKSVEIFYYNYLYFALIIIDYYYYSMAVIMMDIPNFPSYVDLHLIVHLH